MFSSKGHFVPWVQTFQVIHNVKLWATHTVTTIQKGWAANTHFVSHSLALFYLFHTDDKWFQPFCWVHDICEKIRFLPTERTKKHNTSFPSKKEHSIFFSHEIIIEKYRDVFSERIKESIAKESWNSKNWYFAHEHVLCRPLFYVYILRSCHSFDNNSTCPFYYHTELIM